MECPMIGECPDAEMHMLSECDDDSGCDMGGICCRDTHGCMGTCIMPRRREQQQKGNNLK